MRLWIHAARPKTLFIGAAPILIGTVMALKKSCFHPFVFLWTILGALFIQIGTNYSNDYFDFLKGADTASRKGPYKVLEQGLIQPRSMKVAFTFCFIGASLCSLILALHAGPLLLVVGALCITFSILYTAPPFPLAYLGLGDIFVLIFYGPVATICCYYLQALHISTEVVICSFIPGLLGLGPLTMNNLRDHKEDALVNKKTLVVRFGMLYGKLQYLLSLSFVFCIPLFLVWYTHAHLLCISASLSTLLAIPLIKSVFQTDDALVFQSVFIKTAKLVPLYTLLFCIGYLI
jgi:1,4-dihydroxy-2-naphthoate octaprenyltransferase